MLAELRIKNFAILSDLRVTFSEGLNLLTGETGAGKSIIVDALSMFVLPRAPLDLIKSGAKEAVVEAIFYDIPISLIEELSEEFSINTEDGLILRRILTTSGKTRAYINDSAVSIQRLVRVGSSLLAIHGQHEHQDLLRPDRHCLILDRFANLTEELKALSAIYQEIKALQAQLNQLKSNQRERLQRQEFLEHQIVEINEVNPKLGELEELADEYNRLSNAVRLRELAEEAYAMLYGDERSALDRLHRAVNAVNSIENYDHAVSEVRELLNTAIAHTEDAVSQLRGRKDSYEVNPSRLERVGDRLDALKRLLKKYGDTIEDVLRYRETAERELEEIRSFEEDEQGYTQRLTSLEKELEGLARSISHKRKAGAETLQGLINKELKALGFNNACFSIEVKEKTEITETGMDDVEFLFSANTGEPLRPLSKVASGGELSRIMLAIKVSLLKNRHEHRSDLTDPQTLIFDEVDAGIGGNTANQVGQRLRAISQGYQTICITHLPQIAALADHHLLVEKETSDHATIVSVKVLDTAERTREIARMLSGQITDSALRHAEDLIKKGKGL